MEGLSPAGIATAEPQIASNPAPKAAPSSRKAKWLLALMLTLVGGEFTSRLFWRFERGAPIFSSNTLWYAYYPQFRTTGVEERTRDQANPTYDVLILGGSTISPDYGPIGVELGAGLEKRLGRKVRVYNLAFPAHNSRDSLLKHRRLAGQSFDLVVLYDGINDSRMNNVPGEHFREDYGHCAWYKHLNYLDRHPVLTKAALPFTAMFTADRVGEVLGLTWFLPRLNPRAELTEYGKDIRSRGSFAKHYEEMVTASQRKGERVVLMTFAYHLPMDVPDSKNVYRSGKSLVEIWGQRANVAAAIDQHNEAIRELVRSHPEVVFIDQAQRMEGSAEVYDDCCHFTPAGCRTFAQNILAALPLP